MVEVISFIIDGPVKSPSAVLRSPLKPSTYKKYASVFSGSRALHAELFTDPSEVF
jgi:hypothetical protein